MTRRKKVLTKSCPSCNIMILNDDGEFECKFGKCKVPKILEPSIGKIKFCKLRKD